MLPDDPVQSMDDVNGPAFAGSITSPAERRQLIISTHERRLAGLLKCKRAPRLEDETAIVLQPVGSDRTGPSVARAVWLSCSTSAIPFESSKQRVR